MQHERAIVKKAVKKYKTKSGEKESISVNINLGANSEFNDGDNVTIILSDDFDKIADISADDIAELENNIADKDAIINANNENIDNLNAELQSKFNIINDVTGKLKASEKTVDNLESDISAKDKRIVELTSEINELKENNKNLLFRLNELTDLLSDKDEKIDALSVDNKKHVETIADLNVEIAKYDIDDIDELKQFRNVSFIYQQQVMEYIMLVSYKDKEISAYKNQSKLDKLFGRDATADIIDDKPALKFIDYAGNPIADAYDDNIIDTINPDKEADENNDNVDDSGDESMILI